MCECYKIGGPFIAEDPDCFEHGLQFVKEREHKENKMKALNKIEALNEFKSRINSDGYYGGEHLLEELQKEIGRLTNDTY